MKKDKVFCFHHGWHFLLADEFPMQKALEKLYSEQIKPAYKQGLSAAVYTQLSDVEEDVNGIVTYDRKVVKLPPEIMRKIVNVE